MQSELWFLCSTFCNSRSGLPDLKMYVNEYSVQSKILSTGLGTDNPEHILQLQKLCEHVKLSHTKNLEPL